MPDKGHYQALTHNFRSLCATTSPVGPSYHGLSLRRTNTMPLEPLFGVLRPLIEQRFAAARRDGGERVATVSLLIAEEPLGKAENARSSCHWIRALPCV